MGPLQVESVAERVRVAGSATAAPNETTRQVVARLGPGLAVVSVAVVVAWLVNLAVPVVSPLMIAVVLGAVYANTPAYAAAVRPGVAWATRWLLRGGVVLLGLQLSISQVFGLGPEVLLAVVVTVVVAFFGTWWLGQRMGASRGGSLLIATGFSICGASAVAAVEGVIDREDDEVAAAIALITVFGGLAIFVLPLLQDPLGLSPQQFGLWAGASVHEVAQVVATASAAGSAAVAPAAVVKLTRVVLLAPLVAGISVAERRRRQAGRGGAAATEGADSGESIGARRPPIVPLFVLGFLGMIAVRSTGLVPHAVLQPVHALTTLLLAAALFGLGTNVRARSLVRTGPRSLLLGLASTVLVAAVSYAAFAVTGDMAG